MYINTYAYVLKNIFLLSEVLTREDIQSHLVQSKRLSLLWTVDV